MEYKFRKDAGPGSWCTILLPLCLLPLVLKNDSGIYLLQFTLCLTSCLLSFLSKESQTSNNKSNMDVIFHIGFSLPLSFILWYWFSYNIVLCFVISCASLWYYSYLVKNFLANCPGSFTYGEAQIISQGVILYLNYCVHVYLSKWNFFASYLMIGAEPESVSCLQVVLIGTLFLVQILYMVPILRRDVLFVISCFIVLMIMVIAWNLTLRNNIFLWLISFCFETRKRVLIILFWIFCTLISVLVVFMANNLKNPKVSTTTRKYFHFIISAIYIPGILFDLVLLRFASGIVLSIFILLEVCRILNILVIGPLIEDAFQVFLDEKDSGTLILTHIYLFIGCSSPIWLYVSGPKDFHLSLLSGVISVGFGDTAASVGGTLFGRHYWKGSKKTYEGSICAFIVQLIVSFFFLFLEQCVEMLLLNEQCNQNEREAPRQYAIEFQNGHSFSTLNVLLVNLAVLFTTLLEAKTTQVDNLVLPLFMFSFLSWIN